MIVTSAWVTAVTWPALVTGTTSDIVAAAVQVDAVAVVSAPEAVQVERVLKRPGMTEERLRSIMGRQVPDAEKRRRAQFVIDTVRSTWLASSAYRCICAGSPECLRQKGYFGLTPMVHQV